VSQVRGKIMSLSRKRSQTERDASEAIRALAATVKIGRPRKTERLAQSKTWPVGS